MVQDSPELLFRMIVYIKEHDGVQFWALSGNLDRKHSLETQDAGAEPYETESQQGSSSDRTETSGFGLSANTDRLGEQLHAPAASVSDARIPATSRIQ